MVENPKLSICNNVVLIAGIVAVAAVSCVSLFTGHNHVIEAFGVISTISVGAPHLQALYKKKQD